MLKAQAGSDRPDQDNAIDLGAWEITGDLVRRYTEAVGDALPLYFQRHLAPPLALSAWALGRILNHMDLPSGAIHSLQEMGSLRAVGFGEMVSASVRIGEPRRRGGLEFITAAYSIRAHSPESGRSQEVMTGKTTVLVTGNGDGSQKDPSGQQEPEPVNVPGPEETGGLPTVERTIDQPSLDAYAKASGDLNPLHLDPRFAATTRFGAIIAHGMLTLALISEDMAGAFGRDWLDSGALKVRFKGAAYLGDQLATRRRIIKEETVAHGRRVACSVGVIDTATGKDLVSGTASVSLAS
jgi:3-hydroxybutyryl-CoA dehydratase